jgi:hypothetical protein
MVYPVRQHIKQSFEVSGAEGGRVTVAHRHQPTLPAAVVHRGAVDRPEVRNHHVTGLGGHGNGVL